MGSKYWVPALFGSFAVAYIVDHFIADKKIFGGTTPTTVSNKEWWEETEKSSRHGLGLRVPSGHEPDQSPEILSSSSVLNLEARPLACDLTRFFPR
ncbi:monopolar spindle protein [Actinidia rufa]|uniref:Monopolar spindle protein n=1 Tax=Actinidia rufa TaxID=165716 RepID=A0A7J0F6Y7_9ERIC|nr:monopolar spindle protein [Actinidia rufa]